MGHTGLALGDSWTGGEADRDNSECFDRGKQWGLGNWNQIGGGRHPGGPQLLGFEDQKMRLKWTKQK